MADETSIEAAEPTSLEDKIAELVEQPGHLISADITAKFERSKSNREETEHRWLKSYQNFRGRYGDDINFLSTEVSRVFVKITKTKTLAAYGQLLDVLLGGPQFPITVGPTEKPIGVKEAVHVGGPTQKAEPTPQEPSLDDLDPIGFEGDGKEILPNETVFDRMKRIVSDHLTMDVDIEEGGANTKGSITVDPAQLAAEGMTKKIQDQLTEANMPREFRKFLFEMVLLGASCLKGPFYEEKEYPNWDEDGNYDPIVIPMPVSKFASAWDIYPDDNATSVDDSEWLIERHKMTKQDMRALRRQPFFRRQAIEEAIEMGANYRDEDWEYTLREGNDPTTADRFEVLEYWGVMDREKLESFKDLEIPEDNFNDEVDVNVFVCNGIILRLVVNPFKPTKIPYYVCPFEEDPYNFFGVGLPENMEDSQTLMNGFTRMAVDNAVLSGHVMLEVDEDVLAPGQTMDIYAGKIWRKQTGTTHKSVNSIEVPNTSQANMLMYDKFRQLADESTGVSSFSHGQTGVSGVGRTAAGISMLMNAASGSTKTVIKNIDDYVLEPLGRAYFAFNMQFDYDPALAGDLEVKATGTSSLMQKEVKSQRLLQLVQIAAGDPELSARLDKEYILKEISKSLELDPDKTLLSEEKAQLSAALFPAAGGTQAPQGPLTPQDQTGGGGQNIGVGSASLPGEPQFSAGTQQPQPAGVSMNE